MYTVAVQRELIARHYMVGGDFGPENDLHSHRYRIEWRIEGRELDGHGFLVDIDQVFSDLDAVLAGFRDRTLNHLPAFTGLNPSIEHFARVLWQALDRRLDAERRLRARVTIWENDSAWASYSAAACASD
jgi:6-pyruvoyltetrahydropterin/6-carboxytetrahydropterin synthase